MAAGDGRRLTCVGGKCRDACKVKCGPNSECLRTKTGGDICQCPKGFAGVPTAQQGCVRIPETCSAQSCSEVDPKSACYKGYCMPECTTHAQCARGEQCLKGMCLKICRSDKNCLQGEICVDKFCDPGCRTDSDCRDGEECGSGQCACKEGFVAGQDGCKDVDECQVGQQGGGPICPPPSR